MPPVLDVTAEPLRQRTIAASHPTVLSSPPARWRFDLHQFGEPGARHNPVCSHARPVGARRADLAARLPLRGQNPKSVRRETGKE
jgi:hypothetical protein